MPTRCSDQNASHGNSLLLAVSSHLLRFGHRYCFLLSENKPGAKLIGVFEGRFHNTRLTGLTARDAVTLEPNCKTRTRFIDAGKS